MEYELNKELTGDERVVELEAQILWDNHLATAQQALKLKKKVHFNVKCRFAIPVTKDIVLKKKKQ